jgi:hypothetical protein
LAEDELSAGLSVLDGRDPSELLHVTMWDQS